MAETQLIKIKVIDFTKTPGPRFIYQGDYSGELYRETILAPAFEEALEKDAILYVDLDGTAGYPTSFLEEAFGGLARKKGIRVVQEHLQIHCDDEPYLPEEIATYVEEADLADRE